MRGLTLVELMITLAIVAILGTIAYPMYTGYAQRSRRSDAWQALSTAQAQMEQCYSQYFAYNNASCAVTTASPSGYYQVQIASSTSASAYTLTATPTSPGLQTADTSCSSFSVSNGGIRSALNSQGADSSSTCWPH
ncbi:type IV pilin protein [Chromobacterium vaccinii]|uniref:type IV pilin protein n=1 Tax=Chromobacterium vaccinii TaxID=1108595 RepID=UPI001E497E87|nr:type IV pilin protein [Chromobacterium vaccinii]MCD4500417.1 prepilin-type N-terminal cleavage/methylation domain-containing protein [Chromobacterium vaccinii]